MNSNNEDAFPKEIKIFLQRRQQFNQSAQAATQEPFRQATTVENTGKTEHTAATANNSKTEQNKEGNCFYCE